MEAKIVGLKKASHYWWFDSHNSTKRSPWLQSAFSGMEAKMVGLKKVSHCWWFDSHNSAKRSPWLQSALSELEEKTMSMLHVIEGDADSFAQRAEMYYKKRPEMVNMIEDFYRSYRFLAEQYDLLRSEAGTRRSKLFHSDSSYESCAHKRRNSTDESCAHKRRNSTDAFDYPDSEVSEIVDPEPEEAPQFETMLMAAEEEIEGNGGNIDAKLIVTFSSTAVAGATVEDKINMIEVPTKNYKSNRTSYSIGDRQMETNNPELQHQNGSKLMKNDKSSAKPIIEVLEICSRDTMKLTKSPVDCSHSNEYDNCHTECIETIAQFETDHPNIDDHKIIGLYDMIVGDVAKLKSQVERLKVKNKTMNAELKKKDEEKRHVIRQLSLAVEILKEENANLKRFIKASKKWSNIFELKKLKDGFSGTRKLFGITLQLQPSLVAL